MQAARADRRLSVQSSDTDFTVPPGAGAASVAVMAAAISVALRATLPDAALPYREAIELFLLI